MGDSSCNAWVRLNELNQLNGLNGESRVRKSGVEKSAAESVSENRQSSRACPSPLLVEITIWQAI
jgi:hypothetical protein